jgi:hypothetical protein
VGVERDQSTITMPDTTYREDGLIHLHRSKGYEIETKELPDKNTVYTLVARPARKQLSLV